MIAVYAFDAALVAVVTVAGLVGLAFTMGRRWNLDRARVEGLVEFEAACRSCDARVHVETTSTYDLASMLGAWHSLHRCDPTGADHDLR